MNSSVALDKLKKIVSVEVLHLDELGYGPNGTMTREAWREVCWENLTAGKTQFEAWQKGIEEQHTNSAQASFGLLVDGHKSFDFIQNACTLDFARQEFKGDVNVEYFEFILPCNFWRATFRGNAHFWRATFRRNADFWRATFTGDADFSSAAFTGDAYFSSATFTGHTNFGSATFTGDAYFRSATFTGVAYFSSVTFTRAIAFQSSSFEKLSYFENAVLNKVGHFEVARFTTAPPCFRGCEIEKTRLELSDDRCFPQTYADDADIGAACRDFSFLKRLSDQHGQTDQALNFNAMELKVKKLLPDAGWGFKLLTWLYELVSDFGRSFMRPLAAYLALILCSLLLTLPFTDYSQDSSPETIANRAVCQPKDKEEAAKQLQLPYVRAAFEYAMFRAGGVMDFTDTGKQNNAVNCKLFGIPIEPDGMRFWGIVKSIASLALLFLAALGLRNKYRIK